jgi:hypothetical protein
MGNMHQQVLALALNAALGATQHQQTLLNALFAYQESTHLQADKATAMIAQPDTGVTEVQESYAQALIHFALRMHLALSLLLLATILLDAREIVVLAIHSVLLTATV